jgi:hypothetical protein
MLYGGVKGLLKLPEKTLPVMAVLLILCIVMMTNVDMAHRAQAGLVEDPYVYVSPPMYVANALGQVFTVDINISNVQDLRAFEFKLGYNTTFLNAVGVAQGSFFPSPPEAQVEELEINKTMGFVWVSISLPTSVSDVCGSGTLAIVTFNVTFAPAPSHTVSCVLNLYDTLLYDGLMTAIAHDSSNGLYFWNSVQADPPLPGLELVLSTQNGETGQGGFAGNFTIGETVEIDANVTYNDYPVAGKLVGLQVAYPGNQSLSVRVVSTNANGSATADFVIPSVPGPGNYTVFTTVDVADQTLWGYFTFEVVKFGPPRDPQAAFTESTETPVIHYPVYFDASTSQPGFDGDDVCPITEYSWNFGDGTIVNTTAPTIYHTYLLIGVYYVTLTVYAPGIPPYIDPNYNVTNTSYPPEKKVVHPPGPVGGYTVEWYTVIGHSQPIEKHTRIRLMRPYFARSMTLIKMRVLHKTKYRKT